MRSMVHIMYEIHKQIHKKFIPNVFFHHYPYGRTEGQTPHIPASGVGTASLAGLAVKA